jgi:uncharacterized protein YdaU (DUF1376 family)
MSNPWYPFYSGDYLRDTAHLSLAEDGAYRRLLDYCYSTGKPIPTSREQAFRICRAFTPIEQEAVSSVLTQFFFEKSDGLHNKRADVELAKIQEITAMRSRAGQESVRKRNARSSTHVGTHEPTHVEHVLPQPQPQPQPQPLSQLRDNELDESQATSFAFLKLGLAGDRQRMLVHDALKSYIDDQGCTSRVAAEGLVERWQHYQSLELKFKCGLLKWLESGLWKSPEKWKNANAESVNDRISRLVRLADEDHPAK